jgi:BRCA1-associated protein
MSANTSFSSQRVQPVTFGNPALGTYHGVVVLGPAGNARRLVAMTDVPPEQVPEGILNLCRAHRSFIYHVRILISEAAGSAGSPLPSPKSLSPQPKAQPPAPRTATAAHGVMSSPSASAMESAASILAYDSTTASRTQEFMTEQRVRQEYLQESSRQYLILFELCSEEAATDFVTDLHLQPYTSLDPDQVCSVHHIVDLEGKDGVSLMSPCFASDFETRTKSPAPSATDDIHNCPVCLEPMDWKTTTNSSVAILTTVCNHSFHLQCLLQWQDSPCPVCRYDHSGLNEALSQCHVCRTTQHNYVCLICGVVSCGVHARDHYEDTLHAYALDTTTQHVWDFCGQGYVHRLLQNDTDGKLVEVNDPNNATSHERSLQPGLSDAQEETVVHAKLEGFASQYYTLLKSQLEQQRIFYEGRLEEIRRDYNHKRDSPDLISVLKQERNQLAQRHEALQRRFAKVSEDVTFLKNMNESLEANKGPMKSEIQKAQRERAEQRDMFQMALPPLENKVEVLMLTLEENLTGRKPAAS